MSTVHFGSHYSYCMSQVQQNVHFDHTVQCGTKTHTRSWYTHTHGVWNVYTSGLWQSAEWSTQLQYRFSTRSAALRPFRLHSLPLGKPGEEQPSPELTPQWHNTSPAVTERVRTGCWHSNKDRQCIYCRGCPVLYALDGRIIEKLTIFSSVAIGCLL